MKFLPPGLGGSALMAWRLDQARFAPTWNSGEGAFLVGGRWNSPGTRAVYCALDPATAILEVAVHKGFPALDIVPHIMTAAEIANPDAVHVITADDLPDPKWLTPGIPRTEQQRYGDALLRDHGILAIPSVVSPHSWNVIFLSPEAGGAMGVRQQEPFVLDPRLHGEGSAR
jgi:RES domain-containing protein